MKRRINHLRSAKRETQKAAFRGAKAVFPDLSRVLDTAEAVKHVRNAGRHINSWRKNKFR